MNKAEIKEFYQKYKLYIFPLVIILSSLILIVFVVYPQTARLITNQRSQGDFINRAKLLEVKAQTLSSLDPEDLDRKVGYVHASFPTDKDFTTGIGILQNLVIQSGFSVDSILLESEFASKGKTQSYGLKIEVLGPMTLLPGLLSKIESSPRLMKVSSIETGFGKDPQKLSNISLNIDMLYSSAPSEFGSVDSPLPDLSEKDEEVIAKLARSGSSILPSSPITTLGPRGKPNPFE